MGGAVVILTCYLVRARAFACIWVYTAVSQLNIQFNIQDETRTDSRSLVFLHTARGCHEEHHVGWPRHLHASSSSSSSSSWGRRQG